MYLTRLMLDGVSRDAFYDGLVRLEELRTVNVSRMPGRGADDGCVNAAPLKLNLI